MAASAMSQQQQQQQQSARSAAANVPRRRRKPTTRWLGGFEDLPITLQVPQPCASCGRLPLAVRCSSDGAHMHGTCCAQVKSVTW